MVMADDVQDLSTAAETPEVTMMNVENDKYNCSQCCMMFEGQGALFKHVHLQHQQHVHYRRKFRCDQCNKTFKSMTGLRNHERIHPEYFDTTLDVSLFPRESVTEIVGDNDILIDQSSVINYSSTNRIPMTENLSVNDTENKDFVTRKDEIFTEDIKQSELIKTCDKVGTSSVTSADKDDINPNMTSSNTNIRKSERRRSGIPRPIRKPFSAENDAWSTKGENLVQPLLTSSNNELISDLTNSMFNVTDKLYSNVLTTNKQQSPKFNVNNSNQNSVLTQTKPMMKIKVENGRKPKQRMLTPKQKTPRTPKSAGNKPKSNTKITPLKARITPKRLTPRNIMLALPDSTKIYKMDGDMFMCKKCGKSFVDKTKLNVHFTVHSKETPEKCGLGKRMVRRNIATQMTTDSPGSLAPSKSVSCLKCDQKFDNEELLRIHLKSHDTKTYSCLYCEKKFRFQSSLKAHSFVHQGEITDHVIDSASNDVTSGHYKQKTDSSSDELKSNIFSIFSEISSSLQFKCRSCDFSAGLPADLLLHMKTHSRQGLFQCKHCSKSYKQQSNLNAHEKIHTINKIRNIIHNNSRIKQR